MPGQIIKTKTKMSKDKLYFVGVNRFETVIKAKSKKHLIKALVTLDKDILGRYTEFDQFAFTRLNKADRKGVKYESRFYIKNKGKRKGELYYDPTMCEISYPYKPYNKNGKKDDQELVEIKNNEKYMQENNVVAIWDCQH